MLEMLIHRWEERRRVPSTTLVTYVYKNGSYTRIHPKQLMILHNIEIIESSLGSGGLHEVLHVEVPDQIASYKEDERRKFQLHIKVLLRNVKFNSCNSQKLNELDKNNKIKVI